MQAISGAKNLITLRLQTQLISSMGRFGRGLKFTLQDARDMMLRDEDSKLRVIVIANMQYKVEHGFLNLFWFEISVC
jgi:hypothetical protein